MDQTTAWVVAFGFACQLAVMMWSKFDAWRKEKADRATAMQARMDAARAQRAAESAAHAAGEAKGAADKAAVKVSEVKSELVASNEIHDAKLNETLNTVRIIHTLSNNDRRVLLEAVADLARWKAKSTNLPADRDKADKAGKELADHDAAQASVDAVEKKKV